MTGSCIGSTERHKYLAVTWGSLDYFETKRLARVGGGIPYTLRAVAERICNGLQSRNTPVRIRLARLRVSLPGLERLSEGPFWKVQTWVGPGASLEN